MKIGERKWHGSEEEERQKRERLIEFGKYLRFLRNKAKLSTRQVGQTLDVSSNYVSEIERGLKAGSDQLIRGFAQVYKVDEKELFQKADRVSLSVIEMIGKDDTLHSVLGNLQEIDDEAVRKKIIKQFKDIVESETGKI